MKCDKCLDKIQNNAVYEFKDKKLCDDCYIDKITSRKGHKTYYTNDPFGYIRRLKGNEPIHPQKFH